MYTMFSIHAPRPGNGRDLRGILKFYSEWPANVHVGDNVTFRGQTKKHTLNVADVNHLVDDDVVEIRFKLTTHEILEDLLAYGKGWQDADREVVAPAMLAIRAQAQAR